MAPLSWADFIGRLLSVFLLIAINAFFVTAEFSIVSVRRSRINQLVDAGDAQAQMVQRLQDSIDRLLSTTQIGITMSSLALGWIGEEALSGFIEGGLSKLPISWLRHPAVAHSLAIPLTFLLLAYLQIVLGGLCPKSVALLHAEELSRILGGPSWAIARFFTPFIWIFNQSSRGILRLLGIHDRGQGWHTQVSSEELQRIITTTTESTGLEADERELLRNVFEFGEVCAAEVMIPRTNVVSLSTEATVRDLLEEMVRSNHTRYPVIGESIDDVRGLVQFKDLAEPLVRGTIQLDSLIYPYIRPVRFMIESMLLSELLPMMQRSHSPMIILVDEYGGTAGLITIQDLLGEILGDTAEPASDEELGMQILDDQTFLVQAHINLEELNDLLNLQLPLTDDYQTLAGFLLFEWQKIPQPGETLLYDDWEFTVMAIEGPRLSQIRLRRCDASPATIEADVVEEK